MATNDSDRAWSEESIAKLQHDLRNPLTAIMGFSQLLQATDLDSRQADCVENVLDGARRLLAMIEAIPDRPQVAANQANNLTDILYIEDDPTNITLIQGVLAHRPTARLRSAADAASGLAAAREAVPQLVLLDLGLPDRPGIEVLRELRADDRTAEVPVVVLSGDSAPATITELMNAGARAYLTKPLDIVEFLEIVDDVGS